MIHNTSSHLSYTKISINNEDWHIYSTQYKIKMLHNFVLPAPHDTWPSHHCSTMTLSLAHPYQQSFTVLLIKGYDSLQPCTSCSPCKSWLHRTMLGPRQRHTPSAPESPDIPEVSRQSRSAEEGKRPKAKIIHSWKVIILYCNSCVPPFTKICIPWSNFFQDLFV